MCCQIFVREHLTRTFPKKLVAKRANDDKAPRVLVFTQKGNRFVSFLAEFGDSHVAQSRKRSSSMHVTFEVEEGFHRSCRLTSNLHTTRPQTAPETGPYVQFSQYCFSEFISIRSRAVCRVTLSKLCHSFGAQLLPNIAFCCVAILRSCTNDQCCLWGGGWRQQ